MSIRAIIDIGTNSVKTLVMDTLSGEILRDQGVVSRLGEGYKSGGRITETAMRRNIALVIAELNRCYELGAEETILAGTMILRSAVNADEFIGSLFDKTGKQVRIISAEEEARWSYLAAAHHALNAGVLVFDLGGGSLELNRGDADTLLASLSLPLGAGILTESYLGSDPVTDGEFEALDAVILKFLSESLSPEHDVLVVGVGGCATTLAAVDQGISAYDPSRVDGYRLSQSAVEQQLVFYRTHSVAEITGLKGMQPGRERIMLAGAMVVSRILHTARVDSFLVSARGWRHYLIENYLGKGS